MSPVCARLGPRGRAATPSCGSFRPSQLASRSALIRAAQLRPDLAAEYHALELRIPIPETGEVFRHGPVVSGAGTRRRSAIVLQKARRSRTRARRQRGRPVRRQGAGPRPIQGPGSHRPASDCCLRQKASPSSWRWGVPRGGYGQSSNGHPSAQLDPGSLIPGRAMLRSGRIGLRSPVRQGGRSFRLARWRYRS